ncbi:hypothetical protein HanHA300_Chr09g0326071 [Helianthus annuus]|nr:hypothetical protein HanHA300_Chr09g0326071 [Helianthus annuus]KAJ0543093.1 hypothetical protein HanHA89_Chr09g0346991 [Helianthus annuus]KAJ0708146.1 hypothetical protein HanLR1_Chr09g0326311 [Helianthus annuus]
MKELCGGQQVPKDDYGVPLHKRLLKDLEKRYIWTVAHANHVAPHHQYLCRQ